MTVAELVAKLLTCDQTANVYISTGDEDEPEPHLWVDENKEFKTVEIDWN